MTLYDEVRDALHDSPFRPKKSRGQNFLIHERVIDSIVALLDLRADDEVVEIGPGLGFVTRRLVERAGRVWAVEIDDALVERLRQARWSAAPGLQLIHGDILTVRLDHILPSAKCKLVGNLPYSIATPVLFRLFEWRACFSSLVLMVQKELADRIVSGPGSKDYGALSLWSQVHGQVSEKITVSPEAFFPRPKVRSTVLKIDLLAEPLIRTADRGAFSGLVRAVFDQRRKTLSNNLTAWLKRGRTEIDDFLWSCDIDPKRRGETLSVAEFINLAGRVNQYGFLSFDR